ncbi:hypothetical protein AB0M95_12800 [Sphaerisporangium sp. NPDC051017]|uniref:hypothetical protein n=1 Tax=Sphaerisporangium sp. NPDC051017 TaxID=3154636 RepID=UPI0034243090
MPVLIKLMRWDNLRLTGPPESSEPSPACGPAGPAPGAPAVPPIARGVVAKRFDTPEFRGMTFYEIQARSIINRVPAAGRVPFEWTINPP